jgi:hypothetical protein
LTIRGAALARDKARRIAVNFPVSFIVHCRPL